MLSVLASPYTPTLAAPTGSPVTEAGQKRAGKLTHPRGEDRCEPARVLEGWRAAAGVGLRGRSNRRLGLDGQRAPRWRPCAATASGGRERTEPEGGNASLRTGKAHGAATSTRLFACHLHGAPGMDLTP